MKQYSSIRDTVLVAADSTNQYPIFMPISPNPTITEVFLDKTIHKRSMTPDSVTSAIDHTVVDDDRDYDEISQAEVIEFIKKFYNTLNATLQSIEEFAPNCGIFHRPTQGGTTFFLVDVQLSRSVMWDIYHKTLKTINRKKITEQPDAMLYKALGVIRRTLDSKGVTIGSITCSRSSNSKIMTIDTTALSPKHHGKGLMMRAYAHIVTKMGIELRSGSTQSPGGMKLWQRLSQMPGITVYALRGTKRVPVRVAADGHGFVDAQGSTTHTTPDADDPYISDFRIDNIRNALAQSELELADLRRSYATLKRTAASRLPANRLKQQQEMIAHEESKLAALKRELDTALKVRRTHDTILVATKAL